MEEGHFSTTCGLCFYHSDGAEGQQHAEAHANKDERRFRACMYCNLVQFCSDACEEEAYRHRDGNVDRDFDGDVAYAPLLNHSFNECEALQRLPRSIQQSVSNELEQFISGTTRPVAL